MADDSVETLLASEASEFTKDKEIDRILNAFPLDAYSVLDLQPGCTLDDIKKQYRKKSLLIHPDKTKNPQAPDAFDKLKKAQSLLADDKSREALDQTFVDARRMLIRDKKWSYNDERLKGDEFLSEWREKIREVLIENELRKRRLARIQMEEEGRLKRKLEEEQEAKRKKRESEKAWEDSRDSRVSTWRGYQREVEKKKLKKKKLNVLG
uniref:ARAD1C43406p n=1 Tax=Blastobotrys adeninivorans TaxID=409370 RepID=A0A060T9C7_BLAAD